MHQLNLRDVAFIARSNELETLRCSFERVVGKEAIEIVTIAGLSGSGKSRLVATFRKRTIENKAFYCTGKCDETRSKEPFSALKDALGELCYSISKRSDDITDTFAKRIKNSIGSEAAVLTAVIPGLSRIIGEKSRKEGSVDVSMAHDRLHYLFRVLIRSITATKPLVLFCDDLHWIDASSLEVIRWLATDRLLKSFMLVGAYRENEVTSGHRLIRELRLIEKKELCVINRISVRNMSPEELTEFIANVLRLEPGETMDLAKVVHEKTLGNPFFSLQFLDALQRRKMLFFSFASVKWEWVDPERIRSDTTISGNVVDLVANKIKNLPPDVQSCLELASCLSSTIYVPLLAQIMEGVGTWSYGEIIKQLEIARHEGLVQLLKGGDDGVKYKFVHDRIQQAAYSLVDEGTERDTLHFRIGHQLLRILTLSAAHWNARHDRVQFLAADQLYRGQSCISSEADWVGLARISLMAGKKAIELSAFIPATQYLSNGIDALRQVPQSWESHHELTISLHQALADVSWCTGEPLESELAVHEVLSHAKTAGERMPASFTLAQVLGSQQKHREAIEVEVQELRMLNVFPRSFKGIKGLSLLMNLKSKLRNLSIDEVVSLPKCSDERIIAAMNMLMLLSKHATYHGDSVLQLLSIVLNAKLALTYGIHRASISSFAQIGGLLCVMFGDAKEGHRLGAMSRGIMKRLGCNDTFTVVTLYHFVWSWYVPLTDSLEPLRGAYNLGLKQGNVEMALMAFSVLLAHSYLSGLSLEPLREDAKSHFETLEAYGIESLRSTLQTFRQAIENLVEYTATPGVLSGSCMDEAEFLNDPGNVAAFEQLYMWKVNVCAYYGDWTSAEKACDQMWKLRKAALSFSEVSMRLYFCALTPLAIASHTGSSFHKRRARAGINAVRKAVTKEHKAINLATKLQLLDAEFLSMNKRKDSETIRKAYDRAITMASRAGVRQDAALGNLRAGLYFRDKDSNWASHYLSRAVELFRDWGADGVAEHWANKYSDSVDESTFLEIKSSDMLGRKRHHKVRSFRDITQALTLSNETLPIDDM